MDVVWATIGGLIIGGALGALIGRLVVYLRSCHQESIGLDEFLALGLIAIAYGVSVISHTYGFLAVFAAGLALQRVKEQSRNSNVIHADDAPYPGGESLNGFSEHADHTSAYMMQAVRGFNDQMERIDILPVIRHPPRPASYTGGTDSQHRICGCNHLHNSAWHFSAIGNALLPEKKVEPGFIAGR